MSANEYWYLLQMFFGRVYEAARELYISAYIAGTGSVVKQQNNTGLSAF